MPLAAFDLQAPFAPAGDQPKAIAELTNGIVRGDRFQTLLGVTGSGKTMTVANVIRNIGKPTLVLSHNKTLAAQLYGELKSFFPQNAVEYFISYYDYYQPEAYVPSSDTYIEKDASINEDIDRLRLRATSSLMERSDVVIVATVSAIYGLGDPVQYKSQMVTLTKGQRIPRDEILRSLVQEGVITPALQVKYIAAAGDISSGYESGRSLEALTNTGVLTPQSQIAVYRAAAKTSSDYERSQILQRVMKKYGLSAETGPAFLDAAKSISSDYELRVLLTAAVKQLPDDAPASLMETMLTTATSSIGSQYDLAEFLITVANSRPLTEAQRARLEQAAESVKSEYDYGRVMSALRKRKTTNSL